ncbi:hypothetical protein BKA61DRAFT_573374 [Leptodontidium sp. MPI-SDFR-AT-0119]|nr:hypothetical protein BKA61DRAFT_573374 [Leptodontidium sp. MPI-SDFR-AT-0119]
MGAYATPPRSSVERCDFTKEGQDTECSTSATSNPNPGQYLPPTPDSAKPSTRPGDSTTAQDSTAEDSPPQSNTGNLNTTAEPENAELPPALETTTTPWNNIIQSFAQTLPANPFYPYQNVTIFDETARNGTLSKAYHKYGFTYTDISGTYSADIRIFTTKKVALSTRNGRPGTGATMVWSYQVGICAGLLMRHGVEALVHGEEEIMTLNYPVYSQSKLQDPSWNDVIRTLQNAVYLSYGIPPPAPEPQPQQRPQPQLSQAQRQPEQQRQQKQKKQVEVPKPQLQPQPQPRPMAFPKTRKPRSPKPVSAPTPPRAPPTTPTPTPRQAQKALLPLSAETLAYYESFQMEATMKSTAASSFARPSPLPAAPRKEVTTTRKVAPSPSPAPVSARPPPPPPTRTFHHPPPPPSQNPGATYYESLRKEGATPKPLPPTPHRLPLPALQGPLPAMTSMPAYFEALVREVESRKRKAVGSGEVGGEGVAPSLKRAMMGGR